jgi:hypothetical protein
MMKVQVERRELDTVILEVLMFGEATEWLPSSGRVSIFGDIYNSSMAQEQWL